MSNTRIFVIDNIDSFIFNLVDFLYTITPNITIYRNTADGDAIFAEMVHAARCGERPLLLLSPGPKSPSSVPLLSQMLHKCKGKFPVLGVCLGHQAIVEHYGGKVVRCDDIMHGKKSTATLVDHPIFADLDNPHTLQVGRYHSLIGTHLPSTLHPIMACGDDIMGVIDDENTVVGYQFHPESILTPDGEKLLRTTVHYMIYNSKK